MGQTQIKCQMLGEKKPQKGEVKTGSYKVK
jgi:hypothetical protein